MNVREVTSRLEEVYARSFAEEWDNPGLQVGRFEKEVKKVYVALDADEENIHAAVESGADLLLTHHPLLIGGIKRVTDDEMAGRRILALLSHDVAHYAMHTNYDVVTMGELAANRLNLEKTEVQDILGYSEKTGEPYGIGRVGMLPKPMTVRECALYVKERFQLPSVKFFGDPDRMVERAALCPGSGRSLVDAALKAKAEVYITGDFGHHDGLDAVDQGLSVIDAGHYGIEHIFIEHMTAYMKTHFPELVIEGAPIHHPFEVL